MTPNNAAEMLIELIMSEVENRDADEKRIIANRIIEEMKRYVPKQPEKIPEIVPMSDAEAAGYGGKLFGFGQHAGERFDDHLEYLEWLSDTKREEWTELHRYLNNPLVKRRRGG